MEKKERVCILIDGANFHHLVLKKIGIQEIEFSFEDFANFLANERRIIENGKRFYTGTVREREGDLRSKQAMSRQTAFFTVLKSQNWEIKTSKLRRRMEKIVIDDRVIGHQDLLKKGIKEIEFERLREKGIDVKIAVDLIVGAVDNKYDTAIMVTSDTDLIPAIDWVRNRKKRKIEYIGFSIMDPTGNEDHTRPSTAVIDRSDIQRILTVPDLKPFIRLLPKKTLFSNKP